MALNFVLGPSSLASAPSLGLSGAGIPDAGGIKTRLESFVTRIEFRLSSVRKKGSTSVVGDWFKSKGCPIR